MDERTYVFEDFASDLLNIESYKDWFDFLLEDAEFQDTSPQEVLLERLREIDHEEEHEDILADDELFGAALLCSKEDFVSYLNHYYREAKDYYISMEGRSGFGGRYQYFAPYNPLILSLCVKYFDSIDDKENAAFGCFLLMCVLIYNDEAQLDYFLTKNPTVLAEISEDAKILCELFQEKLPELQCFIYDDWLAVHPRITWTIGKYLLQKEKYDEAKVFFILGACLDYDGRQSIEPFIEVGKNQYELGMMYYKGLGVEADAEHACELFKMAANNAGEPTIPVIQDMRHDGLLPAENEDPVLDDLYGYGECNTYNTDLDVYYTKLNAQQKEYLKTAAESVLAKPEYQDGDTLTLLQAIYQYRLDDEEKANAVQSKIKRLADSAQ